ncbi:MAG: hypothetical protein ACR2H2_12105 [Solirubrobacteraceae bacterium]
MPTVRVTTSWSSTFDISDDLVRSRLTTTHPDQHAWLRALAAEMHVAYTTINALKRRLVERRDQLRVEIAGATRQGWQLIVFGLGWSSVGRRAVSRALAHNWCARRSCSGECSSCARTPRRARAGSGRPWLVPQRRAVASACLRCAIASSRAPDRRRRNPA